MRTIEELEDWPRDLPHPVMTIGVFDGVHRGHQTILRTVLERARHTGGTSLVLSFDPHPQKVIRPAEAPRLLQTREQKAELLDRLGVDYLIRLPFTRRLSLLDPEQFARQILHHHGIREIWVGGNFRFGHRRSGDFRTLQQLGEKLGFTVREVPPVQVRGFRVSSTLIRRALEEGRASLARHLLGRAYEVRGMVVRGEARGAGLGFPTANLHPENELIPARGVYRTRVRVHGAAYDSVTNIGVRPTLEQRSPEQPVIETHLLGYRGDLYGQPLALEFWQHARAERKFASVEELKEQIGKDVRRARRYFARVSRLREGARPLHL